MRRDVMDTVLLITLLGVFCAVIQTPAYPDDSQPSVEGIWGPESCETGIYATFDNRGNFKITNRWDAEAPYLSGRYELLGDEVSLTLGQRDSKSIDAFPLDLVEGLSKWRLLLDTKSPYHGIFLMNGKGFRLCDQLSHPARGSLRKLLGRSVVAMTYEVEVATTTRFRVSYGEKPPRL